MVIMYYGVCCFKIQSGDVVLAIDPYAKEAGVTPPRFQTDIVLVTKQHPLHANVETLTGSPFCIASPGEYETKGILVEGISEGPSTIYVIEWEGLRLCHVGALSEKNISDSARERIGAPDILFLPVGAGGALDAEEAMHVYNSLEPRVVIPMQYAFSGFTALPLDSVQKFLKEAGSSPPPEEKYTVKKKDVPNDETKIVLLNPLASK